MQSCSQPGATYGFSRSETVPQPCFRRHTLKRTAARFSDPWYVQEAVRGMMKCEGDAGNEGPTDCACGDCLYFFFHRLHVPGDSGG